MRFPDPILIRKEKIKKPHKWFAWYPVRVGRDIVWLETIDRVCKRYYPRNFSAYIKLGHTKDWSYGDEAVHYDPQRIGVNRV